MTDQLLGFLTLYGIPALYIILTISSAGIPFPISLLLVVAGSFTAQGELKLWEVLVAGTAGAISGDQIGYWIGRRGGRRLVNRLFRSKGGSNEMGRAEAFSRRWGGAAVFFSRWLATPLGPWVNLYSGIAEYPWHRFTFWDSLGEVIWVVLYVLLGKIFSDRVLALADLLGNLGWVFVGVIASIFLGWKVVQYVKRTGNLKAAKS